MSDLMGLLDLTPEEKQGALNMGLLQAGLGVLANNTDRGNPMRAIGLGGMQGLQGYQSAYDRAQKEKLLGIEKAKLFREAEAYKRQQDMINDPSTPEPIRQMMKMGVPASEIYKPHNLTEGGSLASIASSYGMGGGVAAPAPGQPEQLSGPGMGAPQPTVPGSVPPGLIAMGKTKPIFQEIDLPNNQTQKQVSYDGGVTFAPISGSAPVDKFAPAKDIPLDVAIQKAKETVGTPENKFWMNYVKKLSTHQPATTVNVDQRGQNAYAVEANKEAVKNDKSQFDAASNAVENLGKLSGVIKHLKTSDASTGMAAEIQLNINRARSKFLADKAAGREVSDTQVLDAALGSDVFPMIQSLGIGARGMDTPAERDYLRSVMTGTITLDKDTLIKLSEIRANIAKRALDKWNERVKAGEADRFFKEFSITKKILQPAEAVDLSSPQPSIPKAPPGAVRLKRGF